jgi:hypothetical protein
MCEKLSMDLYFETLEILERNVIKKTCNRVNVSGLSRLVQWGSKKGTNKYDRVGFPMRSQSFGLVNKRFFTSGFNKRQSFDKPLQESNNNKKYPELFTQLKKLIKRIDPNFSYNSITVNHNFKCIPHFDKANISPSLIIALGDFEGGELNIEGCLFDIHWNPLIMNGSTSEHSTNDFVG